MAGKGQEPPLSRACHPLPGLEEGTGLGWGAGGGARLQEILLPQGAGHGLALPPGSAGHCPRAQWSSLAQDPGTWSLHICAPTHPPLLMWWGNMGEALPGHPGLSTGPPLSSRLITLKNRDPQPAPPWPLLIQSPPWVAPEHTLTTPRGRHCHACAWLPSPRTPAPSGAWPPLCCPPCAPSTRLLCLL